jgi:adenosylmethionine-8-amino-7-oxononanoate aminotransferase
VGVRAATAATPASCAAAIASIQLISQSSAARQHIEDQLISFKSIIEACNIVYKFEHSGCFASIHFSQKKDSLQIFDYNIGGEVARLCYNKGLIIRGNPKSIIIAPGYNMSADQISFGIKIVPVIRFGN